MRLYLLELLEARGSLDSVNLELFKFALQVAAKCNESKTKEIKQLKKDLQKVSERLFGKIKEKAGGLTQYLQQYLAKQMLTNFTTSLSSKYT